jgi:hypothetical protein
VITVNWAQLGVQSALGDPRRIRLWQGTRSNTSVELAHYGTARTMVNDDSILAAGIGGMPP